jgi:dipeptidyl aminopeptidase/acylaminoacyl peptidase
MLGCVLLTLLLVFSTGTAAQEEQRLSAEVLWQLERVGAPIISPDGEIVVVPVTTYDPETDEAETRLWALDPEGEEPQRPLTAKGATASSPVFSPDGSTLAFVSERGDDEAGQGYLLPLGRPGEAQRLTEFATGVSALRWVGEHLYFISNIWASRPLDEQADAQKEKDESKVSAFVWDDMPYSYFDHYLDANRARHLFRIPARGGEVENLTGGTGLALSRSTADTGHYDVSPDERLLAFVADSNAGGVYPNPDIYLLDLDGGEAENITDGNPAPDTAPRFSPSGSQLAYVSQAIPGFYGDTMKLRIRDLDSGRVQSLHEDWDRSMTGLTWRPDGQAFLGSIGDAGTVRGFEIPVGGGEPRAFTGDTDFGAFDISDTGRMVALNQSSLHPARVVVFDDAWPMPQRIDSFNDDVLADVAIGTRESVTYTGADGRDIQMWVHYPPGFDEDKEYPLFLLIHGGPHGAITDNFHYRWNAQTFASWGYVTAWPNFHGSASFGQDFTDSINPDWMNKPYADVMAAAEWFKNQDWIDEDRMVAGGGSYGGYLSTVILGREHPFNALVIHAAVYDLYAQMSADFTVHGQRFGEFWDRPEIYREVSPHYYAANFKTPSLIIHGQTDLRVPVGQAFELYRTLQTKGIDSRLVYYPDENHWILKRSNSLHWYGEVRDWIAKYAEPGPR